MTKRNYRHKVTKIIASLNDSFVALFPGVFEEVSDNVASKGITVEDNAAALEAKADDVETAETKTASKEGTK